MSCRVSLDPRIHLKMSIRSEAHFDFGAMVWSRLHSLQEMGRQLQAESLAGRLPVTHAVTLVQDTASEVRDPKSGLARLLGDY